jgi:Flp pilus assembly pilin Flp
MRRRVPEPDALGAVSSGSTERGASIVEYALLIGLIVLVAIVAMQAVGTNLVARFQEFASMFTG